MEEKLESLKDILARFTANKSESEYGLQLEASITLPLDVTIYHVPVLDEDGDPTGKFTDKCVLELSCGYDTELREEQASFLTGTLRYDGDYSKGGQGIYLEDIIAALKLDDNAPAWTIQEAE